MTCRYPRTAASWCSQPHKVGYGCAISMHWTGGACRVRRAPRPLSGPPTAGTWASSSTTHSGELTRPAVHRKRWPVFPPPRPDQAPGIVMATSCWGVGAADRAVRCGEYPGRGRGDGGDAGRRIQGRVRSHVAHVSPRRQTLSVLPLRTAGRRGHVRWFSRRRRREPVASADIGHRCASGLREWPPVLSARRHADGTTIRRSPHGAPGRAGARGPGRRDHVVLHRSVFGVRRRCFRLSDRIGSWHLPARLG